VIEPQNLVVTVILTQDDYRKALVALASPKRGLARRILFWISLAFLGYMFYSLISTSDYWPYRVAFVAIFVAVVVALIKYGLPYRGARSFIKKNPDKLGPSRHEIGPEGTTYQGVHGEGKLAWTAFYQIRETPDLFLLYIQSNFAQIVPKRCFEKPEEILLYREIVRKHYKGRTDLLE
jgi:hypothetical protein